jgi:hypothetical protein
MRTRRLVLSMMVLLSCTCFAQPEYDAITSDVDDQLERLSKVNFHPNLLPIILENSDYMELTTEQIAVFKAWGKANFKPMVATMNEIIRRRIQFKEAALSPSVSAEALRGQQEEIFQLHRKLLDYKLSCREKIFKTFTKENWEGFLMVLGEEGFSIPDAAGAGELATFHSVR